MRKTKHASLEKSCYFTACWIPFLAPLVGFVGQYIPKLIYIKYDAISPDIRYTIHFSTGNEYKTDLMSHMDIIRLQVLLKYLILQSVSPTEKMSIYLINILELLPSLIHTASN